MFEELTIARPHPLGTQLDRSLQHRLQIARAQCLDTEFCEYRLLLQSILQFTGAG